MKIIGWIRYGDKTACGGTVVEGVENCTSHGRSLAFQGARIACRKGCVILEGVRNATLPNGRPRAIHGMLSRCGCPCVSTLNDIDGISNESGEAIAATFYQSAEGEWLPAFTAEEWGHEHDQHLILQDQDGQPLEGIPYRQAGGGNTATIDGVSGVDGATRIVSSQGGGSLGCDLAKHQEGRGA